MIQKQSSSYNISFLIFLVEEANIPKSTMGTSMGRLCNSVSGCPRDQIRGCRANKFFRFNSWTHLSYFSRLVKTSLLLKMWEKLHPVASRTQHYYHIGNLVIYSMKFSWYTLKLITHNFYLNTFSFSSTQVYFNFLWDEPVVYKNTHLFLVFVFNLKLLFVTSFLYSSSLTLP